jgi:hypothetical protein
LAGKNNSKENKLSKLIYQGDTVPQPQQSLVNEPNVKRSAFICPIALVAAAEEIRTGSKWLDHSDSLANLASDVDRVSMVSTHGFLSPFDLTKMVF